MNIIFYDFRLALITYYTLNTTSCMQLNIDMYMLVMLR